MSLPRSDRAFTLVELLVVVGLLAFLISILLPTLNRMRELKLAKRLQVESSYQKPEFVPDQAQPRDAQAPVIPTNPAVVRTFDATIALTPKLSVGTSDPESIYEATFKAKIDALHGEKGDGPCEVALPLPPQIISLANLTTTVNGTQAGDVMIRDNNLVWQGQLASDIPSTLDIQYSAVGRGIYMLQTPPGKILDSFKIALTANGSDVRMLQLSLQPTQFTRSAGTTTYTWAYQRLMFGRPIALDVLGIAPIDRLGELSWLGPVSVVLFGMLIGLFAHAYNITQFDRWMLLLVLGTFTGAYPLMYFAQEFISIQNAIAISVGAALLIIGWRAITIMGFAKAMLGVILSAATILSLTLLAAIRPPLQGIILTILAMIFFVAAMLLIPKIRLTQPPFTRDPALA